MTLIRPTMARGFRSASRPSGKTKGHAFEHGLADRGGVAVMVQAEQDTARMQMVLCPACVRAGQVGRGKSRGRPGVRALPLLQQRAGVAGASEFAAQSMQEAALNITVIWCQRFGRQWQNACTARAGVRKIFVAGEEKHAGGAEREEGVAFINDADALAAPAALSPPPPTTGTRSIPQASASSGAACQYVGASD